MIRKFFSEEIGKLRKMDFAEKRWYIWAYYKFQMFLLALIVIVAGSFINHRWINPPMRDYVYIAWNAGLVPMEVLDNLGERLSIIVEDERQERYEAAVRSYMLTDDPQMNQALITRFHAMIQIGALDAMIMPLGYVHAHAEFGIIKPITDVMAYLQTIDPAIHDHIQERALFVNFNYMDTEEYIEDYMAISLQDSPLLTELGFNTSDMYIGIIITSPRPYEMAKALAAFFYDN